MPPLLSRILPHLLRFLPLIVLSLPVAELLLDLALYRRYGDGFLLWLAVAGMAGVWLIVRAKESFRAALRGLSGGEARTLSASTVSSSLWSLLSVARAFFAGLLLLVPGVLTDVLALVIVLLPGRVIAPASFNAPREAANDGVIEGEFHEVKDETPKLR
jgi:UPF0716 protein FxsA